MKEMTLREAKEYSYDSYLTDLISECNMELSDLIEERKGDMYDTYCLERLAKNFFDKFHVLSGDPYQNTSLVICLLPLLQKISKTEIEYMEQVDKPVQDLQKKLLKVKDLSKDELRDLREIMRELYHCVTKYENDCDDRFRPRFLVT